MDSYQAIYLMIAFGSFILALISLIISLIRIIIRDKK
ncbi:putative holin-like toxin [Alkaliphilus crotonatoxidans]